MEQYWEMERSPSKAELEPENEFEDKKINSESFEYLGQKRLRCWTSKKGYISSCVEKSNKFRGDIQVVLYDIDWNDPEKLSR